MSQLRSYSAFLAFNRVLKSKTIALVKTATKVLYSITRESEADNLSQIQENALRHGTVVWVLMISLSTQLPDLITISAKLCGLWIENYEMAIQLLKRVFLLEVRAFLKPAFEQRVKT